MLLASLVAVASLVAAFNVSSGSASFAFSSATEPVEYGVEGMELFTANAVEVVGDVLQDSGGLVDKFASKVVSLSLWNDGPRVFNFSSGVNVTLNVTGWADDYR